MWLVMGLLYYPSSPERLLFMSTGPTVGIQHFTYSDFKNSYVYNFEEMNGITNMLSSGIVPNIYNGDELTKIREEIKREYKKAGHTNEQADAMNEFFFNRVKDNLHICICMSPIGKAFRDYCRMYPALINNTTINWFMGWPEDALTEVAMKFVG